jgi:two-component system, NtrC family, sensor kinase
LQIVLDTLTKSAAQLCAADLGLIFQQDGDVLRLVANLGISREAERYWLEHPVPVGRGSTIARALLEGRAIRIPDVLADPEYRSTRAQELAGYRSTLAVPLLRDGTTIGVFGLGRKEPNPFTDNQVELVTTFADQAVIAIENARLLNELRQRTDDLTESLEQQTATSEVLGVISSSPGELEPVFVAMLENAIRLFQAKFGAMFLYDGEAFRTAALHGVSLAYAEARRKTMVVSDLHPNVPVARVARTNEIIHVADARLEQSYVERDPRMVELVDLAGARSLLVVPMLKESRLIGVINIYRQEVRPFTDKQIELVKNFAAQAVIAIENARLLNELRQRTTDLTERTADLTEALEQQTATSEVLQTISGSPGDLEPVFSIMLENMVRVCHASFGAVHRCHGDVFQFVAERNSPPAYANLIKHSPFRPGPLHYFGPMIASKSVEQVADLAASQGYLDRRPEFVTAIELGGVRTGLQVPMLKENELIGAFALARTEVRPFTDKQIELVQNFAAQAVIAIENARLLNELRQSLEQQTATAGVLQVISSSLGELGPIFRTILQNATRICGAKFGNLYLHASDGFRLVASDSPSSELASERLSSPLIQPAPGTGLGRMVDAMATVQIADVLHDRDYPRDHPLRSAAEREGTRTLLCVPMIKETELIGAIVIFRQEVRPFTDRQIELVKNFAAQAVIAIENARLLNELRESLQQQTATADVLKVISRSTFDLQTVLDALLESDKSTIHLPEGDVYRIRAHYGLTQEAVEYALLQPLRPGPSSAVGRVALEGKTIQIPDVLADPEYHAMDYQQAFGYRTILGVPLLRDGKAIGTLSLLRDEVSPFTDKQIELGPRLIKSTKRERQRDKQRRDNFGPICHSVLRRA